MKTYKQYSNYRKPTWAPPAWLFGPVWSFLYVLITISFGYVFYLFIQHQISVWVVLPFVLNLIANFAFTPIQFGLRNFFLAAIDVVLVLLTLIWALYEIHLIAPWVVYINVPYLTWVMFASVLQLTVTALNWKQS